MPKKAAKAQKKAESVDDDEIAFLEAAMAANQARIEKEEKSHILPDSLFTSLPTAPIIEHPARDFPQRCFMEYNEHAGFRTKEPERLAALEAALPDLREGGRIHEQVRNWAIQEVIKPGELLYDMNSKIEEAVRRQVQFQPPVRGLAFPCGLSVNECAAHYSSLPGDTRVFGQHDIMSVDFGVAINGQVIDSAFTVSFDPCFDPLIEATIKATEKGIELSGPDARVGDIGAAIEEVINGYQMELNGKILPIKPIFNLGGHGLDDYEVHADPFIPIIADRPGNENNDRMKIGYLYALETFATTGNGLVKDDGASSHFMLKKEHPPVKKNLRPMFDFLMKNFSTLAWSQRDIERCGERSYKAALDGLVHAKVVDPYPPLSDIPGSYHSQHEHCFAVLETGKEIFSRQ